MSEQPANPLRDLLQSAADQVATAAESVERLYRDAFVSTEKLYGLYRGAVADGEDPLLRQRVQVTVPEAGDGTAWAMRSLPLDGDPAAPLEAGTTVWVMFERGERSMPVVMGLIEPTGGQLP